MSDVQFDCPECAVNLTVDAEAAGRSVPCPACGKPIVVPPARTAPAAVPPAAPAARRIQSQKTQYKVVALGDKHAFPGRLDAAAIEHKLNELSQSGWQFLAITRVHWPNTFGTVQEEMLLFFEKPADAQ